MDLTRFVCTDLLLVCKEFGITVSSNAKKSVIMEAIVNAELEEADIT